MRKSNLWLEIWWHELDTVIFFSAYDLKQQILGQKMRTNCNNLNGTIAFMVVNTSWKLWFSVKSSTASVIFTRTACHHVNNFHQWMQICWVCSCWWLIDWLIDWLIVIDSLIDWCLSDVWMSGCCPNRHAEVPPSGLPHSDLARPRKDGGRKKLGSGWSHRHAVA